MKKVTKITKTILVGAVVAILLFGGVKPMIDPPGGSILIQFLK